MHMMRDPVTIWTLWVPLALIVTISILRALEVSW